MNRHRNLRRRWLGALLGCFSTLAAVGTASALTVVPVPQNPNDLTVPHAAMNQTATTFKAIVREGSGPYTVSFDYQGDGTYDYTYNTSDPYVLEASYTYPDVAENTLIIANIRVTDNAGDTAFGSYPVFIYADVPTLSNANNATENQLGIMRRRAIDNGLWFMHKQMVNRAGSNNTITGSVRGPDSNAGQDQAASSGAYIWALTLNGYIAAYPPGTYVGPMTADETFQNDQMWNNSPYSEDAIRVINWFMSNAAYQGGLSGDDEGDDGNPAVVGTNDGQGLYFNGITTNRIYGNGVAIAGMGVATAPLGDTVVQLGVAQNQTWPFVGQQMVDWLVWAQMDGAQDVNGMGAWYYTPNPSTTTNNADGSTVQWGLIGLESCYRAMEDYGVYVNDFARGRIANQLRHSQFASGVVSYRNAKGWNAAYAPENLTGGLLVGGGLLGWNDPNQFNCDGANGVNVNEQPYLPYASITRCEAHQIFDRSFDWIGNNFTRQWHDGNYNNSNGAQLKMYAIYSNQKGARSTVPEIADFNGLDWYHQDSVSLLRTQNADGSWQGWGPYSSHDHLDFELATTMGVLVLTPTLFTPKPEAVAAVAPDTVIEGCSGGGAGQVTFSHADSFHPDTDATIDAYRWDADGDGTFEFSTADRNATYNYTYQNSGSFTATLQVEDSAGQLATDTVVITVQASQNLSPSVNAGPDYEVNLGETLALQGSGSDPNVGCGDEVAFAWDLTGNGQFGDASGATPLLSANTLSALGVGAHTITIRGTDENNASVTDTATLTIYDNSPEAAFSLNVAQGSCNGALNADGRSSRHRSPLNSIQSYDWTLELAGLDGQFVQAAQAQGSTANFTLGGFGQARVTLVVTDEDGNTDTATETIDVNQGNRPPQAEANGPYVLDSGDGVTLSAAGSSDADVAQCGDSVTYAWDLDGDGQFDDGDGASLALNAGQVSSIFAGPANPNTGLPSNTVTVRVTDAFGISHTDSATLTIFGTRPVAAGVITPDPAGIAVNGLATINLDARASGHESPEGQNQAWTWDLDGDGSVDANGEQASLQVVFNPRPNGDATRTVRLTVTDANGNADTTDIVANFRFNAPQNAPTANAGGPYVVEIGQSFTLDASNSSDADEGAPFFDFISRVEWDLNNDGVFDFSADRADTNGDGRIDGNDDGPYTQVVTAQQLAGLGINADGDYPVTVRVTDGVGLTGTDGAILDLRGVNPIAEGSASVNVAGCNQDVSFDGRASSHENPDKNITAYAWDFESDGTFDANTAVATHAYPAFGNYTATLRVSDADGRTDEITIDIAVSAGNLPPVGETNGPYEMELGDDLTLDASGSGDPDSACGDSVVTYEWLVDLGNGEEVIANGANPTVAANDLQGLQGPAHPNTGLPANTLILRVTDSLGRSNTAETTLTVYGGDPVPVADAQPDPAPIQVGNNTATTRLDATGSSHQNPVRSNVSYSWDLDDNGTEDANGAQADLAVVFDPVPNNPVDRDVRLTVTDDAGNSASVVFQVTFQPPPTPPVIDADPTDNPETGYAIDLGQGVTLDASASYDLDVDDFGDFIARFEWDVDNDGTADSIFERADTNNDGNPDADGALQATLALTAQDLAGFGLDAPGEYTVTLRGYDALGLSNTDTTVITVYGIDPIADAAANTNQAGCDQTIEFTGEGSSHQNPNRNIVAYAWDFDYQVGSFEAQANGQTVNHEFDGFGDYTVALRVTDDAGRTSIDTVDVQVNAGNRPPEAALAGPIFGTVGAGITLDASASVDPDADCGDAIATYGFDIDNDGTVDVTQDDATLAVTWAQIQGFGLSFPADPESGAPNNTISVTVTDGFGATSTVGTTVTLYGNNPRPSFEIAANPTLVRMSGVGVASVDASGSGHDNPGRNNVTYSWDLDNDGDEDATGAQVELSKRFEGASDGDTFEVPVRLTVTDDEGASADVVGTLNFLYRQAPNAPVLEGPTTFGIDFDGVVDLTISTRASRSGDANAPYFDFITEVAWDLDRDGQPDYTNTLRDANNNGFLDEGDFDALNEGEMDTVTFTYDQMSNDTDVDAAGEYTIDVYITDASGLTTSGTRTLNVYDIVPVADFQVSAAVAACGEELTFDASNSSHTNPNREIVLYQWDFDSDGSFDAEGQTVDFTYTQFGDFVATLRVTDAQGNTDTHEVAVEVSSGNRAPSPALDGPYTLNTGEALTINASASSDPDEICGDAIASYTVALNGAQIGAFGAGFNGEATFNAAELANNGLQGPANPNTHQPGNTITLTVTDGFGVESVVTTSLVVYDNEPVAVFGADTQVAGCGTPFNFDAAGSFHTDPRRGLANYAWDFSYDGNFQAEANGVEASNEYTTPGDHVVALQVTDEAGQTDLTTMTVTLSVQNVAPVADAGDAYQTAFVNGNPIAIDLDATDSFDANAPCDSIVSYQWDLDGDGAYDDAEGPVIEGYTNPNWAAGLSQVVRVRVTDGSGASSTADAIIRVLDEPPPSITSTAPSGGSTVCGTIDLAFDVSDPEGDVVTVIASVGGQEIGRQDYDTPDDGSALSEVMQVLSEDIGDGEFRVTLEARDGGGARVEDVSDAFTVSTADTDNDGVYNCADNCPDDANADQADTDGDGLGDACETDTDNDGVADDTDNCIDTQNPGQDDQDADGLGDACDLCAADPDNDIDNDGICGDVDNCPRHANPGQVDDNGDGFGDVCVNPDADLGEGNDIGVGVEVGEGVELGDGSAVGDNVNLGDNADLGDNVQLGDNVDVGEGADLGNNVQVEEDVAIGDGANIENGVEIGAGADVGNNVEIAALADVGDNADIGDNVVIQENVVVGNDVELAGGDNPVNVGIGANVGDGSTVDEGTVIGNGVEVGAGSDVGANVELQPNTSVGEGAQVADNVTVNANSDVGDNANIGEGAIISDYVEVGNDVTVGAGTEVGYSATVGDNVTFGANGTIRGTVGNNVTIGDRANMRGRVTVNDNTTIGDDLTMRHLDTIGTGGVIGNGFTMGSRASIGDRAQVANNVVLNYRASVGHDAVLADEVQVDDSTQIGDNANIGARTRLYSRGVVGNNVTIGQDCIIGNRTTIGDNTVIEDYTIVYREASIGANVIIRNSGAPDTPRNIGHRNGQVVIGDGAVVDEDLQDRTEVPAAP
ncbi:MAG: PKD domain-containing protein [Bradymonadia bacterium]